jgi:hypothetical protein
MIDYTQGSDHDVFLGLGIPSSMFGHDPDWTHHSSEDGIDKVDASELRRVGSMAGAAAWWLAGPDPPAAVAAAMVEASELERKSRSMVRTARAPLPPSGTGGARPRRLTILPIDGTAWERLAGADKEWWEAQEGRFEDRGVVVYEAVNFMDGSEPREIAGLLPEMEPRWTRPGCLVEILEKAAWSRH